MQSLTRVLCDCVGNKLLWTGVRMRLHGRVFVDVGFQAMRALTNLPLCDPVGCHCV